jgi:hypothetical protein
MRPSAVVLIAAGLVLPLVVALLTHPRLGAAVLLLEALAVLALAAFRAL